MSRSEAGDVVTGKMVKLRELDSDWGESWQEVKLVSPGSERSRDSDREHTS